MFPSLFTKNAFAVKSQIETYVHQTENVIREIAKVTGSPDNMHQAARIVTAFFHTLRERIVPEESMHFIAQLPMLLKAIYVDGWKLSHKSTSGHAQADFPDRQLSSD